MGAAVPVRDPRTGLVEFELTASDREEVAAAAERLRKAQPDWADLGVNGRIEVLTRLADLLDDRRDELVELLTRDTGRTALSHLEVDSVRSGIGRAGEFARALLDAADDGPRPERDILVDHDLVPYRLVGAIGPWNFPLQLSMIDAVPALLAGSACLLKPSEVTPRFVSLLRELIAEVPVLSSVLEVVLGGADTGQSLVDQVDVVCFTGSVATGRKVAVAAAEHGIPAFLELGGKDPVIIARDADLDVASSAVVWGSTANTGHSCMSLERVYVDAAVAEEFIDRLAGKAEAVRLAYPTPRDGDLGPIIEAGQAEVIRDHLEDAYQRGARTATGGRIEVLDGGNYLRPTVLTDVTHDMRVMQEETFGPVMPVMVVEGEDEAVRLANDTTMGLSGAVFAGDLARARALAARLEVGAVSINDVCLTGMYPVVEKNAFKDSGLGPSRMGPSSVARFLRTRAYLMRPEATRNPWFYDEA